MLHRNLLLPLGIKFVPEIDSDDDSDQEEEPELEICQVESRFLRVNLRLTNVKDMTPLAQSKLEHGRVLLIHN